jgi:hypothetical protein
MDYLFVVASPEPNGKGNGAKKNGKKQMRTLASSISRLVLVHEYDLYSSTDRATGRYAEMLARALDDPERLQVQKTESLDEGNSVEDVNEVVFDYLHPKRENLILVASPLVARTYSSYFASTLLKRDIRDLKSAEAFFFDFLSVHYGIISANKTE